MTCKDISPADELALRLPAGEGYEADGIEDLMDRIEGRKDPKPIRIGSLTE